MPKIKTHKGAAKRFKITGTGKILRRKGYISHNRRKMAPRTKRLIDEMLPVSPADAKNIRRLLPYA
ncbi:MAG: 50S ribosomal protein L35 [Dehalococcoidia bacterium]|nr:50S ribosomal protein L35 [Dehalococcoidia bacterium]